MALNIARSMEILVPTAERKWGTFHLSPRPSTLDGKALGLMNNNKEAAKPLLNSLAGLIGQRYRLKEVVRLDLTVSGKRYAVGPAAVKFGQEEEEVLEFFNRCDAVLVAMGD